MGANFDELAEFQRKLNLLVDDMDNFAKECDRDLAGRLLSYVIPDTPVGKNRGPGGVIKGGTLRRGWTSKTHSEAESGSSVQNVRRYANTLDVDKHGKTYTIDIINPVEYSMYVEYGHRTRGGKGFVPGQHMLTNSVTRLEPQVSRIIDGKIQQYLDKLEE